MRLSALTIPILSASDPSGITGMRREHIRAVLSWRRGPGRYDCAFINTDDTQEGMLFEYSAFFHSVSLTVARIHAFSFDGSIGSLRNAMRLQECGWWHHLSMKAALVTCQSSTLKVLSVALTYSQCLALSLCRMVSNFTTRWMYIEDST
jgi:hypothetical protein